MKDIKSSEGYMDLTPYDAMKNITRQDKAEKVFRPLVYICSPYRGDVEENTKVARKFCRFVTDKGQIPVAPHLLFPQFMDEETERELALFMGIILMGKCQEVWVLGEKVTEGMSAEIEKANQRRQKVRYFNAEFEEVQKV